MIHGGVNGRLEAILPIPVFDSIGQSHLIDTAIDTGFVTFQPSELILAGSGSSWLVAA